MERRVIEVQGERVQVVLPEAPEGQEKKGTYWSLDIDSDAAAMTTCPDPGAHREAGWFITCSIASRAE